MKACVLHAIGDLRYEEAAEPKIENGRALVRVAACGVCGSDMPRIFEKGTYKFPTIPGHELAGVVERVEGEADLKPGSKVAVFPLIPCGKCHSCKSGYTQLCDDYDYLGSRSDGGFAEYVSAPIENCINVPDGVSLDFAAMCEPCGVALHALRRGGIGEGDSVWIVGAGTIGLILAQLAAALGASRVFISDIEQSKLDMAKQWDGIETFNSRESDPVDWVFERTDGKGADLVVEAVGIELTVRQAIMGATKRGRVVLMGNPAGDINLPRKDYWEILRRELTVCGTWNSDFRGTADDDWHTALDMTASGKLDLEPLISHRVGLDELPELLARMRSGAENYIKVIVKP